MDPIYFFRLYTSPYHTDIKCSKCYEIIIPKDSIGNIGSIKHICYEDKNIINKFLLSLLYEKYKDFDAEELLPFD